MISDVLSFLFYYFGLISYFQERILVISGSDFNGNNLKTEVINLTTPEEHVEIWSNKDLEQIQTQGSFGVLLKVKPIIGGGRDYRKYSIEILTFDQDQTTFLISQLYENRCNPGIVQLDNFKLWITGGDNSFHDALKSTEIFDIESQEVTQGPDLPFSIYYHTMVKIDKNSIYLIGGEQNDQISNKTWIVRSKDGFQSLETSELEIIEGPPMKTKRKGHSCAKMEQSGKILIVVAGGFDGASNLDSVEILDPSSESGWIFGK